MQFKLNNEIIITVHYCFGSQLFCVRRRIEMGEKTQKFGGMGL